MLDIQKVKELLSYDPKSGFFTWNVDRTGGVKTGDRAGYINRDGYRAIKVQGKLYAAHRIAFLMMHGYLPKTIDHIDRDRDNNAISNLRECSESQNQFNKSALKSNTSGKKGVTWNKSAGKWQAQSTHAGKQNYLGIYDSLEEASDAYQNFCSQKHGEFYAGRER